MNKEELLKLLQTDSEIIQTIKNIYTSYNQKKKMESLQSKDEEIEMLQALVKKWKECFSSEQIKTLKLTETLKTTEAQLQTHLEEKEKLTQEIVQIQSQNLDLIKTLEVYSNSFDGVMQNHRLFSSLSESTKSSLKGIFKDRTLQGFLACGIQEKNIDSFWEYLKNEIIEDKNPDTVILVKIFYFLFQTYTLANPIYRLQEVNISDTFDTEQHINHSNSKVASGSIVKIELLGWINSKTEKIVKKSIVRI